MTGRTSGVNAFWWTLEEFCDRELLPYVFADAEDERNQYTMVVHRSPPGCVATRSPPAPTARSSSTARRCRTYDDLVDFIVDQLTDDATRADWAGPVTGAGHDQRVHPPAAQLA